MTHARPRVLGAALALATAAGCAHAESKREVVEVTAAERGAKLFDDPAISNSQFNVFSCATCHETTPGASAPAILPGAPLAGSTKRLSYWGGHEIDLLRSVNDCLSDFMLNDEPWTADDENARLVYAYLDTLPADGAEAAPFTVVREIAEPPAGDATRGSGLYRGACATCHGALHTGTSRLMDIAPVLPEGALAKHPLGEYTAEERRLVFVEKIRHGGFLGAGGQMPPFSAEKLSDQQVGDVLALLGVP